MGPPKEVPKPEPSGAYVLLLVCMRGAGAPRRRAPSPHARAPQFLTTAVAAYFLGKFRVVDVDAFRWEKLKAMAPINVVFYLAIFTNGQVLTYSTVETFIAFRSLTPLLVSGVDTLVRGEAPPSRRTAACLLLIALGAVSYARDDAFRFEATRARVYLVVIATEMNAIAVALWPLAVPLGRVPLSLLLNAKPGEPLDSPFARDVPPLGLSTLVPLATSCVLAIGISFSASPRSATAVTTRLLAH
ncbi:nucleotide-sugar transmembrane transporter [Aureococcus anophagefferens]|nr:nucleotide-sugar transmembrane transporter [Aureococcus anophagefferens]